MLRAALAGEHAAETTVLNGRTWLVAAHPLHDEDGTAAGAVAVLTFADEADVHRELTEKEALNEQFGALIELSKDFIAIADLDGTVTFVNRAGRALVGLPSDEDALGRPTADYFTEQGKAKSQEIEEAVREHGYLGGRDPAAALRHRRGDPGVGQLLPGHPFLGRHPAGPGHRAARPAPADPRRSARWPCGRRSSAPSPSSAGWR